MMGAIASSGLGCDSLLAEDCDVTLLEKNPNLGRKLLLSGKGRCNLTNACELDSFLERFSKGEFLRDAFKKFFNQDLMRFFEKRGLHLKVERQLRVFPESDKAASILDVLKEELAKNNVKVIRNAQVKDVIVEDNKVKGVVLSDNSIIQADKVILATGGASYAFTGSTGDGIAIAKRLGHKIVPFRPGLVPLDVKENYPKLLEGVALKNISITFSDGKRDIVSKIGELMFTKTGISGPLVLTLSGQVADWLSDKEVHAEIDLKPGLSDEQLNARITREIESNPRRALKNMLKTLLPERLVDVFISILKLNPDQQSNQINAELRKNIVSLLKGFRLTIARTQPLEEAMVTRGGVSLKDINPRTMESRLIKGLYFAGEMIDVDADTGGFNLQAAFSTGYLAGNSSSK